MLLNILSILGLVLYIAIAAILARQYLRTRNIGFVWLGVAVVIWPVVSRLLEAEEKVYLVRLIHHQSVFYPFTLVANGQMTMGRLVESFAVFQQLIGVCLLLVAVFYLSVARDRTIHPTA